MSAPLVALTGATGFLGAHILEALAKRGFDIRILARKPIDLPPHIRAQTEIIIGDLTSEASLEKLLVGASAIIHSAGLTRAVRRQDFMTVNRDGASRMAHLAKHLASEAHFILISSQAAREPALSAYAASKRQGEDAVRNVLISKARLTILRPPAIYGPGDHDFLPIFKLSALPLVPLLAPASHRVALAYVGDIAEIAAMSAAEPPGSQSEINLYSYGGTAPQGYSWREILTAASSAQSRRPAYVQLPQTLAASLLQGAGILSGGVSYLTGKARVFSLGKAREMLHSDWSIGPGEQLPDRLHPAATSLDRGFMATIAWYRAKGLLR